LSFSVVELSVTLQVQIRDVVMYPGRAKWQLNDETGRQTVGIWREVIYIV